MAQCVSQPEAVAYLRSLKTAVLGRWILPPNNPDNAGAEVRFSLDASGNLQCLSFRAFSSKPMAAAIRQAFESAAPFGPLQAAEAPCLAGFPLTASFRTSRAQTDP